MSTRIQAALDGEVARESLRPEEARELDLWEEAIDTALAPVRREAAPDLTEAVMRRIARPAVAGETSPRHAASEAASPRGRAAGGWKRVAAWLLAPRPVTLIFRPASALAAAAVGALLVAAPWPGRGGPDTRPAAAAHAGAPETTKVFVQFRLEAPGARRVELAGDFTDWRPAHTLSEAAPGVWTVVVPLEPGVHEYAFVIDGERWVPDPLAPRVDDGFGGSNSRLDVLAPIPGGAL
ncbi:MAG TPA: glycogen-binding domain-containing protein [Longimicrobiales bacterium]